MPYQCQTCNKIFIHAAKEATTSYDKNAYAFEKYVFPYCCSREYTEYKEPVTVQNVLAHVQVPHSEVNNFLAQGYTITDKYAKEVTMQKFGDKLAQIADAIHVYQTHNEEDGNLDRFVTRATWLKNAVIAIMNNQPVPIAEWATSTEATV